jgi:hypothetical protein
MKEILDYEVSLIEEDRIAIGYAPIEGDFDISLRDINLEGNGEIVKTQDLNQTRYAGSTAGDYDDHVLVKTTGNPEKLMMHLAVSVPAIGEYDRTYEQVDEFTICESI